MRGSLMTLVCSSLWVQASSQSAWAMSQAPGQEVSGVGGLLFGLFYLSMVVVPILVIVGANWLFRKFLCEACDANPASAQPGETGTTSVNESHPHVRFSWSSLRLALGIGSSLLSALLILTVEGSITTTDAGDLRWPLYWAMVFGPYYVFQFWGAPRRGGSSSRVVLLVTIGAMAVGWSLFFLNDLG